MDYAEFKRDIHVSKDDICREIFSENRESIRVKKEITAMKNLGRIFDSALRISNKNGFQAMSMRDLSKEAGLSMGALYAYFSSKEALLEIIQRQGRAITKRILEKSVKAENGSVARLRAAIRSHIYLSEIMQPWFYFSYMETKNLGKEESKKAIASELFTEHVIAGILRQGRDEGIFVPLDPQLTASVIKAMLQDWYLKRWKYTKRKISVDQYARFVMDFVEAYCLSPGFEALFQTSR